MPGEYYRMLREVLDGQHRTEVARLTAAQIDLSVAELDRSLARDTAEAERDGEVAKGKLTQELIAKNLFNSSLRESGMRRIENETKRKTNDLRAQAAYVRDMLAIERKKLASVEKSTLLG